MTIDRTNQTIKMKVVQVLSKADSGNPKGGHALHIHLYKCKVQNPDDLYGSFDHDSDGFH